MWVKNQVLVQWKSCLVTGKSMSEALIFALTNPQYDNRLLAKLPFICWSPPWTQYCVASVTNRQQIIHWITSPVHENSKLRTWGEHDENMLCTQIGFLFLFWHSEQLKDWPIKKLTKVYSWFLIEKLSEFYLFFYLHFLWL